MKETFTYDEIMKANQAAMQLSIIKVPQKTAYRLSKLLYKLSSLTKDIDKERLALYKKFGTEKNPGQGDYTVGAEQQVKFMEALDLVMGQTLEVEFLPIACNMFTELPAQCIFGMGKFMIEEEKIVMLN